MRNLGIFLEASAYYEWDEDELFKNIRIIVRGEDPWFVLKDICLKLDLQNPSALANALDPEDRTKIEVPTPGGKQSVLVISEGAFLNLMMRSKKPEAKPFRRWIIKVVLPEITRTGGFTYRRPTPQYVEVKETALPPTTKKAISLPPSRLLPRERERVRKWRIHMKREYGWDA